MASTPGFILSNAFKDFFESEKAGGLILIICTVLSMVIANSGLGDAYHRFWLSPLNLSFENIHLDYSIEEWINDGLMAIFFLMVGLEIERELYIGELSDFKNALLPVVAAIGGMTIPALIHFLFNHGTAMQSGIGIPMATDIAFSLGILALLGNRVPPSIKIFLTALAIIDDLGAVIIIAIFYTKSFSIINLAIALGIFIFLIVLNRLNVFKLWIYIIAGIFMWYFMLKSGVHATISGVLLAFAIPFRKNNEKHPSYRLQHALHKPVNFIIVPLFALANTGLHLDTGWANHLFSNNSLGIIVGLVAGKPLGIFIFCMIAVQLKWCSLPENMNWKLLAGVGALAGIGFTMSIFITNLAFIESTSLIEDSKIAVLAASSIAVAIGMITLFLSGNRKYIEK
ncbi:MAG: Na+/H+ antiporter NhaA [Bacteroidetes bacterium]|nr:Na+/H+ antiporter NhaA [Bacteroidota bacterium]